MDNEDKVDILDNFYLFLSEEKSKNEFERWIYETNKIEEVFSKNVYYDLISINYKQNNRVVLHEVLKIIEKQIELKNYEKWRILRLLTKILKNDDKIDKCLVDIYNMYCDGYSFFGRIALNFGVNISMIYEGDDSQEIQCERAKNYCQKNLNGIIKEAEELMNKFEKDIIVFKNEYEDYGYGNHLILFDFEDKKTSDNSL